MLDEERARLRIALISLTDPQIGGGRTYEDLLVEDLTRSLSSDFDFLVFTPGIGQPRERRSDKGPEHSVRYKANRVDVVLQELRNAPIGFRILEKLGLGRSGLERRLRAANVDLAYFISPNPLAAGISDIPILTTIWDLAHTHDPEFPEVASRRRSEYRDVVYGKAARKSVAVIVDSQRGGTNVCHSYGLPKHRVVVLPFWSLIESWGTPVVPPRDYVIYPAQFWPHKNHVVLLEAIARLMREGRPAPNLLFVGGDRGNRAYVERVADRLGVDHAVEFTGFVEDGELRSLMLAARGLVMPSYFGPTNMPPVEALLAGIPVAISTCDELASWSDGASIQAVHPADVDGWAAALERFALLDVPRPAVAPHELMNGPKASSVLREIFCDFESKRATWSRRTRGWR